MKNPDVKTLPSYWDSDSTSSRFFDPNFKFDEYFENFSKTTLETSEDAETTLKTSEDAETTLVSSVFSDFVSCNRLFKSSNVEEDWNKTYTKILNFYLNKSDNFKIKCLNAQRELCKKV